MINTRIGVGGNLPLILYNVGDGFNVITGFDVQYITTNSGETSGQNAYAIISDEQIKLSSYGFNDGNKNVQSHRVSIISKESINISRYRSIIMNCYGRISLHGHPCPIILRINGDNLIYTRYSFTEVANNFEYTTLELQIPKYKDPKKIEIYLQSPALTNDYNTAITSLIYINNLYLI